MEWFITTLKLRLVSVPHHATQAHSSSPYILYQVAIVCPMQAIAQEISEHLSLVCGHVVVVKD